MSGGGGGGGGGGQCHGMGKNVLVYGSVTGTL